LFPLKGEVAVQSNTSWNIGKLGQYIKAKGVLSPQEEFFFKALSNRTSFCLSLSKGNVGVGAWTNASLVVVSHWLSIIQS